MLALFQKIFGSSGARAKAAPSKSSQQFEPTAPLQAVEVAHLRLAAILERLPAALRPLVRKPPGDEVTVTLPITTIVKQLPGGSVKVSLATLHRQAPAGIFGPLPPGDKQMVEVPLAEVFRHLKPTAFKRRADQRAAAALDSKFNLFGDAQNPYQIAPTVPEDEPEPGPAAAVAPAFRLESAVDPVAEVGGAAGENAEPEFKLAPPHDPEPTPQRTIAPPPDFFEPRLTKLPTTEPARPSAPPPRAVPVAASAPAATSITLPVEALSASWPEPIRQALATLNGAARVTLPTAGVTAGLARGKVTFTWGQVRGWIQPPLSEPVVADEAVELSMPLKVVAPAFLAAANKPKTGLRVQEIATEIPALFNDVRAGVGENDPLVAAPATATPPVDEASLEAAFMDLLAPPPAEAREAAPAPEAMPASVGELFGQPDKVEWTPAEMVAQIAKLPGVSGAVVALQEGLLVAHSMPGDVRSEVIAAFLPQLFARLNQYSAEMKLGEVDDLLFTTHGAHCQIYRLGYIYFAVLGQPGAPLPGAGLRLVADELARQTRKP